MGVRSQNGVLCWVIPERVRGEKLLAIVGALEDTVYERSQFAMGDAWVDDSVPGGRNTSVIIHTSVTIAATPEWERLAAQLRAEASMMDRNSLIWNAQLGLPSPAGAETERDREAYLGVLSLKPGAPRRAVRADAAPGKRCKPK